jgi:hypothetical protein
MRQQIRSGRSRSARLAGFLLATTAISGAMPIVQANGKMRSVKFAGLLSPTSFSVGTAQQPRSLKGVGLIRVADVVMTVEVSTADNSD